MMQLRDEIEKAGFETNFTDHVDHFRVYVSGRKTINLFSKWLYKNKGLFLKRKYNEFQSEKLPISKLKDRGYKTHKNALKKRKALSEKNIKR